MLILISFVIGGVTGWVWNFFTTQEKRFFKGNTLAMDLFVGATSGLFGHLLGMMLYDMYQYEAIGFLPSALCSAGLAILALVLVRALPKP